MDGERRFVLLMGLEVTDAAVYTRYRTAMRPILHRYGGAFGIDLEIARVLRGAPTVVNRVFTLSFPDRAVREQFFADEEYRAVRAALFERSVGLVQVLAEL